MLAIIYHLRIVLSQKSDAGRMPSIRIKFPKHTNARRRSMESGGAWFVEWSA